MWFSMYVRLNMDDKWIWTINWVSGGGSDIIGDVCKVYIYLVNARAIGIEKYMFFLFIFICKYEIMCNGAATR